MSYILNKKIISCIIFILLPVQGVFSQNLTLKMIGVDSLETSILNELNHQLSHSGDKSVFDEIDLVKGKLQKLGYFTNTLEKVTKNGNEFMFFSFGSQDRSNHNFDYQSNKRISNYFSRVKSSFHFSLNVERLLN